MRPRVFPAEDSGTAPAGFPGCSRRFNEAAGIPRGRQWVLGFIMSFLGGFNEAAGIPRGRRTGSCCAWWYSSPASMRPRVFPAEDMSYRKQGDEWYWASMRPRVFPAEDPQVLATTAVRLLLASMRPRVFPAEDANEIVEYNCLTLEASMRPRVFPAEDTSCGALTRELTLCFNEAAGIPRGRRRPPPSALTARVSLQ